MAVTHLFRVLTWACVVVLAVLSLLPGFAMVHTGLPGPVNHFVAYAGSAAIAVAGYGRKHGAWLVLGLCVYAGLLEYLQQFSPGRNPGIDDFIASAAGALGGGGIAALLLPRLAKLLPQSESDRGHPNGPKLTGGWRRREP